MRPAAQSYKYSNHELTINLIPQLLYNIEL